MPSRLHEEIIDLLRCEPAAILDALANDPRLQLPPFTTTQARPGEIRSLLRIRPSPNVYRSRRARVELRACTDALAPFGNSSSPPSKPAPTSTSSRSGTA
jgi:hypothetical protein